MRDRRLRKLWGLGAFPFYYVQTRRTPTARRGVEAEFWRPRRGPSHPQHRHGGLERHLEPQGFHPTTSRLWAAFGAVGEWPNYGRRISSTPGRCSRHLSVEGDKLRVTFDHVGRRVASRDGSRWMVRDHRRGGGRLGQGRRQDRRAAVVLSAAAVKQQVAVGSRGTAGERIL
jgi:hypothetical protein